MKKIAFVVLSSLSINCYASGVILDSNSCNAMNGENLGGCFQNAAKVDIGAHQLNLVQKTTFANGTSETSLATISQFHPDNFASISWSADELKNKNISTLEFYLANKLEPIAGCYMQVYPADSRQPTIAIKKDGDSLHC